MLKQAPEQYTVGMILRQTEGSLTSFNYDDADIRERESAVSRVWEQIDSAVSRIVDNITLRDLVDWQSEQISQYVI